MSKLNQELCAIIDAQDIQALLEFLTAHPDHGLHHITPNGLSAFWVALAPPSPKIPSKRVIEILANTKRIDPNIKYGQQTLLSMCPADLTILLTQYTEQYRRGFKDSGQGDTALLAFANYEQNTHDTKLVQAVDRAIVELYQCYVRTEVLQWDNNLDAFLQLPDVQHALGRKKEAVAKAIQRIHTDTVARPYAISPSESVELTIAHVATLMWMGLNDADPSHFVFGIDLSPEAITQRKIQFFCHLINSEVNFQYVCWMGFRNHMVNFLEGLHLCVRIAEESLLTSEQISQYYAAGSKAALTELQRDPVAFGDYLHFYPLRDCLGGAADDAETPDKLASWVSDAKQAISDKITHENATYIIPRMTLSEEALAAYVSQVKQWFEALANYQFDHALLPEITQLEQFTILFELGFNQAIRSAWHTPEPVSQLSSCLASLCEGTAPLKQVLEQLKAILIESTPLDSFAEWLTTNEKYRTFIKKLPGEEARADWLKIHLGFIIQRLLQSHDSPALNEDWLWESLQQSFQASGSALVAWFNGLPPDYQRPFLEMALERSWFNNYPAAEDVMSREALMLGLQTGYTEKLQASFELTLEGKDLRGTDLSSLDLTQIHLVNCDLRLTEITKNPTLQAHHLNHNQMDSNYIQHMVEFSNYQSLLKILLHPECPPDIFMMRGFSLLDRFNRDDYLAIFQAIIDNRHFEPSLLFMLNILRSTPVLDALNNCQVAVLELILVHPKCGPVWTKVRNALKDTITPQPLLVAATEKNCVNVVRALLDNPKLSALSLGDLVDANKNCILHHAVMKNRPTIVQALLDRLPGAYPAYRTRNIIGYTPLQEAIVRDLPSIVQLFIEHRNFPWGELYCAERERGDTVLHWAIRKNYTALSQIILARNQNSGLFQQCNSRKHTVLQEAALFNRAELVRTMLKNPFFPASKLLDTDESGTILHWAIEKQQHAIIQMILSKVTSPKLFLIRSARSGLTVVEKAMKHHQPQTLLAFLNSPFFDGNALTNQGTRIKNELLLWAVCHNHSDIIQAIFEKSYTEAPFTVELNDAGDTLLDLALRHQRTDVVRMILAHPMFCRSFLTIPNRYGQTPFDFVHDPSTMQLLQHRYYQGKIHLFSEFYYAYDNPMQGAKKLLSDCVSTSNNKQFFKHGRQNRGINTILLDIDIGLIKNLSQLVERLRNIPLLEHIGKLAEVIVFLEKEHDSRLMPAARASTRFAFRS